MVSTWAGITNLLWVYNLWSTFLSYWKLITSYLFLYLLAFFFVEQNVIIIRFHWMKFTRKYTTLPIKFEGLSISYVLLDTTYKLIWSTSKLGILVFFNTKLTSSNLSKFRTRITCIFSRALSTLQLESRNSSNGYISLIPIEPLKQSISCTRFIFVALIQMSFSRRSIARFILHISKKIYFRLFFTEL